MNRLKNLQTLAAKNQSGFIMPSVIILTSIMTLIAYATLVQANNSLNLAYKQTYIQMARSASKAAIDYAQEQFDSASCGNYNGTPETDLTGPSNSRYRITMQAAVDSTSPDGYEKKIIGTGRIYLPKASASALYVFDIRSEIVRTYAVCKSPDNFAPLVWLDASNTNSLRSVTTSTTTASPTTSYGNAGDSTRDTLEERADNGTQTAASWQSNDFEMNSCDAAEFSTSVCNSNSTKYLNIGMVFSNVNVPRNATITSATITLACTTPAGANGTLNESIRGFYKTSTNPHPDLFTQGGSNQLRTPLNTANLHTSAAAAVSSNNCPPGNNTVWNVTNVAQEVVNNANWDPTAPGNGGRMGFIFSRTSGSGSRHLLKNSNLLSISYSTNTVSQADNGDGVGEWDDLSGNGNHARTVYGNTPTRQDNQINGKPIVRFNNGAMISSLTAALSGKREFTVFAVMNANFTGSTDGRAVSGTSSTASNDTTSGSSLIPLMRNSNNTGFSNIYSGSGSTYRTNYTCSPSCANTPYLYTSLFQINSNNTIDSFLRGNGAEVAQKNNMNPGGSPYTFGINQLYYGGTRTGAMPGSGTSYFNGDYAEIVVYDKALSCRETEALEEYFRVKWAIAGSQWPTTCPADVIPTL